MTIRLARLSDAPALADLSGELGYPTAREQVHSRLSTLLHRDDHAVYVAESEEEIVDGWIHVFGAHTVESDPFAEIGGLVVREAARGRGAGKALIGQALGWARSRGYGLIRVRSNTKRLIPTAWYV